MWAIQESPEVYFELIEAPELVQKKYIIWKDLVKQSGPLSLVRKEGGKRL